jgi:hypothetical protein
MRRFPDELHVSEDVEEFYREFRKELARPFCRMPFPKLLMKSRQYYPWPWASRVRLPSWAGAKGGNMPVNLAQPQAARDMTMLERLERLEIEAKSLKDIQVQIMHHMERFAQMVGVPSPEWADETGQPDGLIGNLYDRPIRTRKYPDPDRNPG